MTTSTWNAQPASGEWNDANNWTPSEVPMNTAVFATSSQTAITFSATSQASVGCIEFGENASAYTFTFGSTPTPALTVSGDGVRNHSNKQQSFLVAATSSGYKTPQLQFINAATAGGDDMFYCAGPETAQGYGGGVISFRNDATAGAASFKVWTGATAPPEHSTVGGEVSFSDSASAGTARFTIYGTLGTDGDTFGNVVFHDTATAANASFTNVGGTVSGGDGGNTQFYDNACAANGVYNNWGGTYSKANGGDVAFDTTSNGGHGTFYNHAARAAGAYGGVTSFNNNWPPMAATQGASAGHGTYVNYGARDGEQGGGGHLEFSARYGSPTAANACIHNYGSTIEGPSSAGHTIFSISLPTDYFPTAGNAMLWNHPGVGEGAAAGFTEFSVYQNESSDGSSDVTSAAGKNVPTAGDATVFNLGGSRAKAAGGYTVFSGTSNAGNATLIAYGGSQGGYGGRIVFYDASSGGTATIQLFGNGELDISDHKLGVTIGALDITGGVITTRLGTNLAGLTVSGRLSINSTTATFYFRQDAESGFEYNTAYRILTNADLSCFSTDQFSGNSIEGVEPTFAIIGNDLEVTYWQE